MQMTLAFTVLMGIQRMFLVTSASPVTVIVPIVIIRKTDVVNMMCSLKIAAMVVVRYSRHQKYDDCRKTHCYS